MGREDELFEKYMLIRQLADAVRNKNMAQAGPLGDTTRGRGRVLSLLKQHDGVSTKEMASIMGIRVSSLNEVLGKMEKEGYVERFPSPDDRRVMLVWLTDKGREAKLPDQKLPELMFGSFELGPQNQMCMYFEQIISSLQNELDDEVDALRIAREQRAEFFERAKEEHEEKDASQASAAHTPYVPTPAQGGMPVAPPSAPLSAPPGFSS